MEVRLVLLLALFAGAMYSFISCFKSISRKQWTTFGKVSVKVAVSVIFALTMIATCGILSRLSN